MEPARKPLLEIESVHGRVLKSHQKAFLYRRQLCSCDCGLLLLCIVKVERVLKLDAHYKKNIIIALSLKQGLQSLRAYTGLKGLVNS